jgi:2-alkyl-3-oxoalkanoate reductase
MRIPAWLGRLAGGQSAVAVMTTQRAASNAKARRELGWEPEYASWRDGFRAALD